MKSVRPTAIVLSGSLVASVIFAGCGESLLQQIATGNQSVANPRISAMLTGDLVNAFVNFRSGLAGDGSGGLTAEQRSAIELLQQQFDAGGLTEDQLDDEVWSVIGDALPLAALAGRTGMAAPLGLASSSAIADALNLDAEQTKATQKILANLKSNLGDLRSTAAGDITSLLSADQLSSLLPGAGGALGGLGGLLPGASSQPTRNWKRVVAELVMDQIIDQLNLTSQQEAGFAFVRAWLFDGAKGLQEQAREQFMGLLNPEQLAALAGLEGAAAP